MKQFKNSLWRKMQYDYFRRKCPWCWERLKAKGEDSGRGWDGWIISPTQWTWVWASSRWQWRTGNPGALQFVGLQRVGQYLAAEQQPPLSPVLVGGQLLGWVSIIQLKIDTIYWGSTRFHRLRVQSYQTAFPYSLQKPSQAQVVTCTLDWLAVNQRFTRPPSYV